MKIDNGNRHAQGRGDPLEPSASTAVSLREPLLDAEEAAELLHVRVSWVREATRNGALPCFRLGRHVRYTRSMLETWLADNRVHG